MKQKQPKHASYAFFTIGYEGRAIDEYMNLLLENHVKVLCDVRKNPISRKRGFSKTALSEELNLNFMVCKGY